MNFSLPVLMYKYWRYSIEENKSQKLKILKSQSDGVFTRNPYWVNNNCLRVNDSRLGGAALGAA